MTQPTTLSEAFARQEVLWELVERGISVLSIRTASLKSGYSYKPVPEHGMGLFSVRPDGTVCEFKPQWNDGGTVLLCQECFADGT